MNGFQRNKWNGLLKSVKSVITSSFDYGFVEGGRFLGPVAVLPPAVRRRDWFLSLQTVHGHRQIRVVVGAYLQRAWLRFKQGTPFRDKRKCRFTSQSRPTRVISSFPTIKLHHTPQNSQKRSFCMMNMKSGWARFISLSPTTTSAKRVQGLWSDRICTVWQRRDGFHDPN